MSVVKFLGNSKLEINWNKENYKDFQVNLDNFIGFITRKYFKGFKQTSDEYKELRDNIRCHIISMLIDKENIKGFFQKKIKHPDMTFLSYIFTQIRGELTKFFNKYNKRYYRHKSIESEEFSVELDIDNLNIDDQLNKIIKKYNLDIINDSIIKDIFIYNNPVNLNGEMPYIRLISYELYLKIFCKGNKYMKKSKQENLLFKPIDDDNSELELFKIISKESNIDIRILESMKKFFDKDLYFILSMFSGKNIIFPSIDNLNKWKESLLIYKNVIKKQEETKKQIRDIIFDVSKELNITPNKVFNEYYYMRQNLKNNDK